MGSSLGTGALVALPVRDGWPLASLIFSIVLPVLAGLAVTGRFYTRRMTRQHLGIDDWLVLVALLFYWGMAVIAAMAMPYGGVGHHKQNLSPERIQYLQKLLLYVHYFYCIPLALAKASLCFFLIRIFNVKRWFKAIAYFIVGLCACFMVLVILIASLICMPIEANWDKTIPGARCGKEEATFVAVSVFDIVIDLAIIALPMPVIWSLRMPLRDKISITALLLFGTFDMVIAAMRIVSSLKINFKADWTFTLGQLWLWSLLEPGLAICVVCLVVMKPLLDKLIPHRKEINGDTLVGSKRSDSWCLGEELSPARKGSASVEATGEPFHVALSILNRDQNRRGSRSKEKESGTPGGGKIVVSREISIDTIDRQDFNQRTV